MTVLILLRFFPINENTEFWDNYGSLISVIPPYRTPTGVIYFRTQAVENTKCDI